ncbi:MAG: glycine zipper family protein [Burkholderiales bacterium]
MNRLLKISAAILALMLGACVTMPNGPSVMTLPGTGKNFDQFRADDASCKQYANEQLGISPRQAAESSAVTSAAVGTVLGAAAGALIDGSRGAASGAGAGLLMGSAAGAGASDASGRGAQRNYDNAFIQCMYAKGHRVPVSGRLTGAPSQPPAAVYTSPPSTTYAPPAPPGVAPPQASFPPPPSGSPPPPPLDAPR